MYESRLGYQKHLTANEFILWVFVVIEGAPLSKLLKVETHILTRRTCFHQSLQSMQNAVVGRSEFSIPQENDSINVCLAEYLRSIKVDTTVGLD